MEKLIKSKNGQWKLVEDSASLIKGDVTEDTLSKANHSVFTMDHVKAVAEMKDHNEAKKFAHDIVDSSTANPMNKKKIKMVIDSSKSPSHLAQAMSNHLLAHPREGLKTIR